jgi:hypothetical protein
VLAQKDADEAGSPGRVLPAEGESPVVQVLGVRGARALVMPVGRDERRGGVRLPAAQELADGAGAQAQGLRDGGGGFAAAVAPLDRLTQRQGSRCWHEKSSRWEKKPGRDRQHIAFPGDGKTRCRI